MAAGIVATAWIGAGTARLVGRTRDRRRQRRRHHPHRPAPAVRRRRARSVPIRTRLVLAELARPLRAAVLACVVGGFCASRIAAPTFGFPAFGFPALDPPPSARGRRHGRDRRLPPARPGPRRTGPHPRPPHRPQAPSPEGSPMPAPADPTRTPHTSHTSPSEPHEPVGGDVPLRGRLLRRPVPHHRLAPTAWTASSAGCAAGACAGVGVGDLLAARARGAGRDLVGLTFDDGYADFVAHALPLLRRHGCGATVFVLPGRLGGDNAWDPLGPRKPLLTADGHPGGRRRGHGDRLARAHPRGPDAADDALLRAEVARQQSTARRSDGHSPPTSRASATRTERSTPAPSPPYGRRATPTPAPSTPAPLTGPYALPRVHIGERDTSWRLHLKHTLHRLGLPHLPHPPHTPHTPHRLLPHLPHRLRRRTARGCDPP